VWCLTADVAPNFPLVEARACRLLSSCIFEATGQGGEPLRSVAAGVLVALRPGAFAMTILRCSVSSLAPESSKIRQAPAFAIKRRFGARSANAPTLTAGHSSFKPVKGLENRTAVTDLVEAGGIDNRQIVTDAP
jgi:hypothetical protein